MIRLATFDMAGTTIDDRHHVYRVLEAAVNRAGVEPEPAAFQRWMGVEKREAIAGLLREAGVEADDARIDELFVWFLDELARSYRDEPPIPLPGVEETLAELRRRGTRVALTTGFSRGIADPILTGLGWTAGLDDPDATLDAVVCADEVRRGRPAPYMIHRAMELTGTLDVAEVSATGDTIADVEAARHAGVLAIGVLTGKLDRDGFTGSPADHVLPGVPDVLDLPEFAAAPERLDA
ncbi:phosphonatase-like hydrolase [Mobilicoccus massiliensis]|uniref:phosphonatase-like hydrolase n=1 Tax=Mobilicoccus massiliensis TaxID=1522310 RepID=UPI00058EFBBB|nr:phosphonatase-like hydrolase [Mobilicoccus massiliensis]